MIYSENIDKYQRQSLDRTNELTESLCPGTLYSHQIDNPNNNSFHTPSQIVPQVQYPSNTLNRHSILNSHSEPDIFANNFDNSHFSSTICNSYPISSQEMVDPDCQTSHSNGNTSTFDHYNMIALTYNNNISTNTESNTSQFPHQPVINSRTTPMAVVNNGIQYPFNGYSCKNFFYNTDLRYVF